MGVACREFPVGGRGFDEREGGGDSDAELSRFGQLGQGQA
ncbi:MAG: hypothetical protein QOE57_1555 [Acidimicrobiaceae bacterium]|nr:hypothetical protein [Acidimicrobiaceae bacterium]